MMSVVSSIAPLVPPELVAVTRAAVIKFREELARYRSQSEEIYNSGDCGNFHYISTWSMIKVDVLYALHGCGAFDDMSGCLRQ
jgi:hypothetical protein